MKKADLIAKVDSQVARFTKGLLSLARHEKLDFAYVGKRPSKTDEVIAVLKEDLMVAKQLMA